MNREVEKLRRSIINEACKNKPDFAKIREEIERYEERYLSLDEIAKAACLATGAAINMVFAGSSKREVVLARDMIIRYLFYQRKMKKTVIAGKVNRDHASVIYSIRKTDQWDEDNDKIWSHHRKIFIKNLVAMKHLGLKDAKIDSF